MTFADAVNSLSDGKAAKRTSWAGYVYRTDATGVSATGYTLTFKNKSGTTYVYTYNGTQWSAPATTVPYDADIMAAMIANDWTTGKTADFESARGSSGTW